MVSSLDDPCTVMLPKTRGFDPPNVTEEMINLNKQLSERGLQYDSKNVTGNNIVFRQRSDTADIQATDYPEYHDEWVEPIYGLSEPRERKLVT